MTLAPDSAYLTTDAHAIHQTHQIRLTALICSSVSLVASTVALYWFFRMDKLFRHR
jgi:hypothetical protein